MRKLLVWMAVLVALPALALAADRNVTISGSIEMNAIHRDNVFDWSDDPEDIWIAPFTTIPHRGPDGLLGTADDGQNDQENFVDVYVVIDIEAELADNVMAKVQLANQRHETDRFGEDGFDVEVTEAWVMMKEFMIPELTVKLGLQDFTSSLREDGNAFLLNTKETFQLGKEGDDYGSDVGGLKLTVDLIPNELSADVFWFRAADPGTTNAWFDAYGAMMGYYFPDEMSHVQLAAINFHDNTGAAANTYTDVLKQYPTYVAAPYLDGYEGVVTDGDWWALSAGIQYFLDTGIGALELYGEGVWEMGDYSGTSSPNPYKSILDQDEALDMDAFGGRVGAELSLADMTWSPKIGASYWYRSGDEDPGDDSQENFVSYGKTVETLIVEDALYGYNLNTNYEVWRLSLAVCPVESLAVKLQYNDFWLNEGSYEQGYLPPRPFAGWLPVIPENIGSEDDFGQEIDLTATYTYSENVTFMLGLGYFMPGDVISDNPRLGRRTSVFDTAGDDDDAFMVDLRTVVTF